MSAQAEPELELELGDPVRSEPCPCCGGTTVSLTRFVYRRGEAYAVYYARYTNGHPDDELHLVASLGRWSEGSTPAQRAAFFCRLRHGESGYALMLGDAGQSAWADVGILGDKLTREEALAHPNKRALFELTDHVTQHDPCVRGFLQRVECGDTSAPLETSFGLPDALFALPEAEREARVVASKSLARLDDARFFVRCLLPLPIEAREPWCVGVWVELREADYRTAYDAWDDEARYAALAFDGALANDPGAVGLAGALGVGVGARVVEPSEPPRIVAASDAALAARMAAPWRYADFLAYATPRGIL